MDGFLGAPGEPGEGGINSPGVKGERGEDGYPGNRVSDIVFVKGIICNNKGSCLQGPPGVPAQQRGRKGSRGEPGTFGLPGFKGQRGLQGERGDSITSGYKVPCE